MKFTNKEDYQTQRNALLTSAEKYIDSGELEKANEIMNTQIPELDNAYAEYAEAQANLASLSGRNNFPTAQIGEVIASMSNSNDMYASIDYRKAFMNYTLSGTAIPSEFRNADGNTKTTDAGAVIPTTIMEKIIEKMEATGMILPLITQTSYKGGLSIPVKT